MIRDTSYMLLGKIFFLVCIKHLYFISNILTLFFLLILFYYFYFLKRYVWIWILFLVTKYDTHINFIKKKNKIK